MAARRAVILAVAESAHAKLPSWDAVEMMAAVSLDALGACELPLEHLDGVFTTSGRGALELAEYLGLKPSVVDSTMVGGASSLTHAAHAASLIEQGRADAVLVAHAGRNRSRRDDGTPPTEGVWSDQWQEPFGIPAPMGLFAMCARLHMDRYGTTSEQFAEVAVSARRWAAHNPDARRRDPLTVDEVLASPMICDPLHVLDCCLVTDAAGALVLAEESFAADSPIPAVPVLGHGQAHAHLTLTQWAELDTTAAGDSARVALTGAGAELGDVDVLQLYDAVTSQVVIMLEDLGFCERGDGGAFVEGGRLAPGGELPTNTQGGGLAFTHPGMFGIFTLIESYRQLSRFYEGTPRQVPDAELGLAHGIGYIAGTHASVVMGAPA